MRNLFRRLSFLLVRKQMDNDLAEEMRHHLAMKTEKNRSLGMADEEAAFAARRKLGNELRIAEQSRGEWGFIWLETVLQDLRYGLRTLLRTPKFAVAAVLTLAIGIGATTAIFSIFYTVQLKPLPYKDPERLVTLWTYWSKYNFTLAESKPDLDDIRAEGKVFDGMEVYSTGSQKIAGDGTPESLEVTQIGPEFLNILGTQPMLGGRFTADDAELKHGKVALISYRLWKTRYGSDAKVVGRTITFDRNSYTITGVLPQGTSYPARTDVWVPLGPLTKDQQQRYDREFLTIARLKQGKSLGEATSSLDVIAKRLGQAYPKDDEDIHFKLLPLMEQTVGSSRKELAVLLGAVTFLLLIACANVSNLVLARGLGRQREMGVRAALGARRSRIFRQLVLENLLLNMLGGTSGMLLAVWGVNLFRTLAPESIPRLEELRADPLMLVFALGISLVASLLSGLAPSFQNSRPEIDSALREGAAGNSKRGPTLRNVLVIVEIALTMVLLTGAALMGKSLVRMLQVDTGMQTDHLLMAEVLLADEKYEKEDVQREFTRQLLERLHADPRLSSAVLSNGPALMHRSSVITLGPNELGSREKPTSLQFRSVTPGFFQTLGIRLVAGRDFNGLDRDSAAPVIIINEALARRYFPGPWPIGRQIKLREGKDNEIVGVVSDSRDSDITMPPRPELYFPVEQMSSASMYIFVRTSGEPHGVVPALQAAVWAADPKQSLTHVVTAEQLVQASLSAPRFRTWQVGAFAITGTLLMLVGVYGVVSYAVGQRLREIAVRVALGARPTDVLRLIIGDGAKLALAGSAVGLVGSLLLTRFLRAQLFEVTPTDPWMISAALFVLFVVAMTATFVPARGAAKVDPMVTLRNE